MIDKILWGAIIFLVVLYIAIAGMENYLTHKQERKVYNFIERIWLNE